MGFFEIFRQKQVEIAPEITVNVEYIVVENCVDIYSRAYGEILFVKRQLTEQDINWLQGHSGNYTIFTTKPETLESFDAQKKLSNTDKVHLMDSIGLNFLHFGDELYAFSDISDKAKIPETPNVVRVRPVHRSDIETQLIINWGAIFKDTLGISDPIMINPVTDDKLENKPLTDESVVKESPNEIDLVRTKLAKLFAEKYSVIQVNFTGTKPESRTVNLTNFYTKHKIASGKLRGTWCLFDKADLNSIIDFGIMDRAKEAVMNTISVVIPGYDTIIRVNDVASCRNSMEKIASDYQAYLAGDSKCKYIGKIEIKTFFSPKEALNSTFNELRHYLLRLWYSGKSESYSDSDYKYEKAVDMFLTNKYNKCCSFSKHVKLKFKETTYKESQWESEYFITSLCSAVRKNPDFFDKDFLELLNRYIKLLRRAGHK